MPSSSTAGGVGKTRSWSDAGVTARVERSRGRRDRAGGPVPARRARGRGGGGPGCHHGWCQRRRRRRPARPGHGRSRATAAWRGRLVGDAGGDGHDVADRAVRWGHWRTPCRPVRGRTSRTRRRRPRRGRRRRGHARRDACRLVQEQHVAQHRDRGQQAEHEDGDHRQDEDGFEAERAGVAGRAPRPARATGAGGPAGARGGSCVDERTGRVSSASKSVDDRAALGPGDQDPGDGRGDDGEQAVLGDERAVLVVEAGTVRVGSGGRVGSGTAWLRRSTGGVVDMSCSFA